MKTLLILLLAISPAWACDGLQIQDGWVREAPPSADVLAGYARFINTSGKNRTLRGFSSPDFSSVEVHEMHMANGEMQMREIPALRVPAHGSVTLAPGSMHLMLFTPKKPLKDGDTVLLDVSCGSKKTLQLKLPVKKAE